MPLKTFENLPEERKKEILNVCFEEFALYTYSDASLSRIIKNLDLAKGSFYRYFKSKKDLYFYLLEYATSQRLSNVETLLLSEKKNLRKKLVENFAAKVKFDLQYPVINGFLINVMNEKYNQQIGDMELNIKRELLELIKKILKIHIGKNEIRSDVDINFIAFTILQVQIGIYDYIELQYDVDFRKNIREKKPFFTIPEEDIRKIVESFTELLETGFLKTKTL